MSRHYTTIIHQSTTVPPSSQFTIGVSLSTDRQILPQTVDNVTKTAFLTILLGVKQISLDKLSQAVRWHRTGLAMLALFIALVAGLSALAPNQSGGVAMVVASRELSAGSALILDDLAVIHTDSGALPDGGYTNPDDLVGRSLTVGLTRGTPITTMALSADALVDHDAGEMLVPFRVHDPDVAALLRAGDRITIVTSSPEGMLVTVAEHIRVAQVPYSPTGGGLLSSGGSSGTLIVVAAPADIARQVAGVSDQWLGVVIE